jgi:hypothetical protein
MNNHFSNFIPDNLLYRRVLAVGITSLLSWALIIFGIYGMGEYGYTIFLLLPLFIGAFTNIIYGWKRNMSNREACWAGMLSLLVVVGGLLAFGIEGLICVAMAAPLAIPLTLAGSLLANSLLAHKPKSAPTAMLALVAIMPGAALVEKPSTDKIHIVTTSLEIETARDEVWNNVIEFPLLEKPTEWIFKTGVAYPIDATIEGSGVGAVRYCNFTTGSFIEPITVWEEPSLLRFDVLAQPAPMRELSFREVDAPHLHNYFVSKEGQFRLIKLNEGKTLLEGTTWYYHRIKPEWYWQLWSEYIIHKIHGRVLKHIKTNAEANSGFFEH